MRGKDGGEDAVVMRGGKREPRISITIPSAPVLTTLASIHLSQRPSTIHSILFISFLLFFYFSLMSCHIMNVLRRELSFVRIATRSLLWHHVILIMQYTTPAADEVTFQELQSAVTVYFSRMMMTMILFWYKNVKWWWWDEVRLIFWENSNNCTGADDAAGGGG